MSIIGSSWKEEPTPEEQYEEITGNKFQGTQKELEKEIEKSLDNNWTSKAERSKLRDLQIDMDSKNNKLP